MIKSACNLMKKATTSSISLVLAGSLLVLLSKIIALDTMLPSMMSYTGFISIFAGVVLMLITMAAVMVPKISHSLDQCQH